jgi:hypothetical protein
MAIVHGCVRPLIIRTLIFASRSVLLFWYCRVKPCDLRKPPITNYSTIQMSVLRLSANFTHPVLVFEASFPWVGILKVKWSNWLIYGSTCDMPYTAIRLYLCRTVHLAVIHAFISVLCCKLLRSIDRHLKPVDGVEMCSHSSFIFDSYKISAMLWEIRNVIILILRRDLLWSIFRLALPFHLYSGTRLSCPGLVGSRRKSQLDQSSGPISRSVTCPLIGHKEYRTRTAVEYKGACCFKDPGFLSWRAYEIHVADPQIKGKMTRPDGAADSSS